MWLSHDRLPFDEIELRAVYAFHIRKCLSMTIQSLQGKDSHFRYTACIAITNMPRYLMREKGGQQKTIKTTHNTNKHIYQFHVSHTENMQQTGRNTHDICMVNSEVHIKKSLNPTLSYQILSISLFQCWLSVLFFSLQTHQMNELDDSVLSVLATLLTLTS